MKDDYIIEMLNITKEFPGIKANDNVTLRLKRGEIHALLGENGAGKSTLMSVLFGLYEPEKGEIRKNGKRVKIKTPNDATSLGIGMVHQHFRLVEVFTVLDNIILGAETTFLGFIKRKKSKEKLESIDLNDVPFDVVSDVICFCIANKRGTTDWVHLPVANFDCYYSNTNFSKKWLSKIPDTILERQLFSGVSRVKLKI